MSQPADGGQAPAALAAVASLGEVSRLWAVGAMLLVALGMTFSYATRAHPPGWVKILVAVVAIAAFAWFFTQVTGPAADITTVDHPLTVLLVAILHFVLDADEPYLLVQRLRDAAAPGLCRTTAPISG